MYDSNKAVDSNLREPLPGYWYINHTGQLMRVRFVAHGVGGIEKILIQDIEGTSQCLSLQDWHELDLVVPNYDQNKMLQGSDSGY